MMQNRVRWRWSALGTSLRSLVETFLLPAKTSSRRCKMGVYLMRQGEYITEYEVKLGTKIAEVLAGET